MGPSPFLREFPAHSGGFSRKNGFEIVQLPAGSMIFPNMLYGSGTRPMSPRIF